MADTGSSVNTPVSIIRQSIGAITQILAGRSIRVYQRGLSASVDYNQATGQPVSVTLPYLPDEASEDLILAVQGFLDHEVGHLLFTDNSAIMSIAHDSEWLLMQNVLEDPFVELCMQRRFHGSKGTISRLHDFFISKVLEKNMSELNPEDSPLKHFGVLLPAITRAWHGMPKFEEFMRDKWDSVAPIIDKLPDDIRDRVAAVKCTSDNVALARTLIDAIMYVPPLEDFDDKSGFDSTEEESDSGELKGGGGGESAVGTRTPERHMLADEEGDPDEEPSEEDEGDEDEAPEGDDGDSSHEDFEDIPDLEDGPDGEDELEGEDDHEGDYEDGGDSSSGGEDLEDLEDLDGGEPRKPSSGDDDEGDDESPSEDIDDGDESDKTGMEIDGKSEWDESGTDKEIGRDSSLSEGEGEEEGEEGEEGGEGKGKGKGKGEGESEESPTWTPAAGESISEYAPGDIETVLEHEIAGMAVDAAHESDYVIYSTDNDTIEPFKCRDMNEKAEIGTRRIRTLIESQIATMQNALQRALVSRSKSHWRTLQETGRINASSLSRLFVGDSRVFRKKVETRSKSYDVSMLIDCSGSMNSRSGGSMSRFETAMVAAYGLGETLSRVGVNFEILGFTTKPHSSKWEDECRRAMSKYGVKFGRIDWMYMPVFKSFDERWNAATAARVAAAFADGTFLRENVDGECVQIAAQRLLRQKSEGKLLIVLSDGSPACRTSDYRSLSKHLRKSVQTAQRAGVKVVGIGIDTDVVRNYYDDFIVLNDVSKLPTEVVDQLQKVLLS